MQTGLRRALAVNLLTLVLSAGCSQPAQISPPNPAPEPVSTPAPTQVPPAAPPPAPAPPPDWADGVASAPGRPDAARPNLRKLVTVPTGTQMHRGPGEWHPIYNPGGSVTLPYGAFWNGWLGLRLERSLVWLPSEGAWSMTDENGDGAQYQVESGQYWELEGADGLRVELRRPSPGVYRVDLTGVPHKASLTAYPESGHLKVEYTGYRPGTARIDPQEDGFLSLFTSDSGLLLEFSSLPGVVVRKNEPGQLSLELRPLIRAVERRMEGATEVIKVSGSGYIPSQTERSDSQVVWRLQGAGLPVDLPSLPTGVEVAAGENGVTLRLPAPGPYRVRPVTGGMELVLSQPGLAGKRIVIDPGHGGTDTGTATPWGLAEKEANLQVSLLLAKLLEQEGARVLLLRTEDTPAQIPEEMKRVWNPPATGIRELSTRSAISNWYDADLLISVHHNGGGFGSRGTETYWHTNLNGERSLALARSLQREMLAELGLVDRGVIRRSFAMVRLPVAPAALVEIGFLTNEGEARYVTAPETQARAAQSLARGIRSFFAPTL